MIQVHKLFAASLDRPIVLLALLVISLYLFLRYIVAVREKTPVVLVFGKPIHYIPTLFGLATLLHVTVPLSFSGGDVVYQLYWYCAAFTLISSIVLYPTFAEGRFALAHVTLLEWIGMVITLAVTLAIINSMHPDNLSGFEFWFWIMAKATFPVLVLLFLFAAAKFESDIQKYDKPKTAESYEPPDMPSEQATPEKTASQERISRQIEVRKMKQIEFKPLD